MPRHAVPRTRSSARSLQLVRARRTGSTPSGRPWRTPAQARFLAVVAERAFEGAAVVGFGARPRRTGRRRRNIRSRCRCPAGCRRRRTRCARSSRSDTLRGSRRFRSACRRRTKIPTKSSSGALPPKPGCRRSLHELHVPPGGVPEPRRCCRRSSRSSRGRRRDVVPFLARHLAGFAADAEGGVGEKRGDGHAGSGASDCVVLPRQPAGNDVADQRLGFHDAHVGLFADRQQVVHDVAGDEAAVPPVIRQSDLVHALPVDPQRRHARRHQRARLDRAARSGDGHPVAVRELRLRAPARARSRRTTPAAAPPDAKACGVMPPAV